MKSELNDFVVELRDIFEYNYPSMDCTPDVEDLPEVPTRNVYVQNLYSPETVKSPVLQDL